MIDDWHGVRTLVTGGASFIGSHLTDKLVARGAEVTVADDFSSGRLENLNQANYPPERLLKCDLRREIDTNRVVHGQRVVFHLAAAHGGRGYVDRHPAECAENLLLDGLVFRACVKAGVEKVVYASSGCVYPLHLQWSDDAPPLAEDDVGPPYHPDGTYGFAKLAGELTLRAYAASGMIQAACPRYFTAYGPRGHENHAVLAMIARAFVKQDPYDVWGDGGQVRNWTHVNDVVEGTLRAAERIDDGAAINVGTTERVTVRDAAELARKLLDHAPRKVRYLSHAPTGPRCRVADDRRCREQLGWTPTVRFADGLRDTVQWYVDTHEPAGVAASLERRLTERT